MTSWTWNHSNGLEFGISTPLFSQYSVFRAQLHMKSNQPKSGLLVTSTTTFHLYNLKSDLEILQCCISGQLLNLEDCQPHQQEALDCRSQRKRHNFMYFQQEIGHDRFRHVYICSLTYMIHHTWKLKIIYNFTNTTENIQAVYQDFLSQ